eukprot:3579275-Amphidinium_carterae.1
MQGGGAGPVNATVREPVTELLGDDTPRQPSGGAGPRAVLHDPTGPDSCLFQCVAYHLWNDDAPSQ